jgi:hypothetical protein
MTRRKQSGHAIIELAFSTVVMASCLGATFQFGYSLYVYDQLVSAVGNAGRYAASRTLRAATPEDIEKGTAAIRNMVVYADARPAPDAAPIVPNLRPENVQVSWVPGEPGDPPRAVDVQIVHYAVNAVFGSINLDQRPAAEFPFVGRYAPSESEP